MAASLTNNFKHVNVDVVDCPNLTAAPFHLVAPGLGGSETIVEIGGPPYLLPLVDRTKIYDLKTIATRVQPGGTEVLAIGAGAGYFPMLNTNCEGIFNMKMDRHGSTAESRSYFATNQSAPKQSCTLHPVPADETRCALLANILMCEGAPGKVFT